MTEEYLEGVLDDATLDELAADLGISPDVMRKHPFFRVLKGRIMLTYPLKGGYSEMLRSEIVNLASGEFIQVPAGHHVVAINAGDADFANLKLQFFEEGAVYRNVDWALTGLSTFSFVPVLFKSDGKNFRITAVGADVDSVWYVYVT